MESNPSLRLSIFISNAGVLIDWVIIKGKRKEYQSKLELPEHLKEIVDLVQE